MGLYFGRSSSSHDCSCSVTSPMVTIPDPSGAEVVSTKPVGDFLIAIINYPDALTYEGRKVLVYKGVTAKQLKQWKKIDPHFSHKRPELSPIARFLPTHEGERMAELFCRSMQMLKDMVE